MRDKSQCGNLNNVVTFVARASRLRGSCISIADYANALGKRVYCRVGCKEIKK